MIYVVSFKSQQVLYSVSLRFLNHHRLGFLNFPCFCSPFGENSYQTP